MNVYQMRDSRSKKHWLCFRDEEDPDKALEKYRLFDVPYPFHKESIPLVADLWEPIKVEIANKKSPYSDYPSMEGPPTFSERAVNALRDLLEPNGELLPLDCPDGNYYAYHVTTFIDALDKNKTEANWYDEKRDMVKCFTHVVFNDNLLTNAAIFQIPQSLFTYWVTETFVDRVIQAKLKGFVFNKVWPVEYDPKRHI